MKYVLSIAVLVAILCSAMPAIAEYVGPAGAGTTVKEIGGFFGDDHLVILKGTITRRVAGDLYEFNDGTGSIYLDMDHHKYWPRWPADRIDETTRVEVYGKYIHKHLGFSKVKVIELRVVK